MQNTSSSKHIKHIVFHSCFFCFLIFLLPSITVSAQRSMNWTSFKWGSDTVVFDGKKALVRHSAIFLPVNFAGDARQYYLQLDLSSTATIVFYKLPLSIESSKVSSQLLSANTEINLFTVNSAIQGKLGISDFKVDSSSCVLMRYKKFPVGNYYLPAGKSIIGLLGLGFFKKRELMIDFPRQQFTLAGKETILPLTYRDSSLYVPLKVSNNRLSVPVSLGDSSFSSFFYETGNSVYDVVVSKSMWQELTGRTGNEKENIRLEIETWGNESTAIGIKIHEPLKIGKWVVKSPTLFFLPDTPDLKSTYGCDGFFGNSVFFSKTIILDVPRHRLGIMNEM